ncbi:uncharacterized protein LOC120144932 [Hibiscus syriacus]|uniref:uncharacterized protein LOC120144932 n=1 Tax=Hibiscus syriacus TaxID=106335 RepID=UPI0019231B94|nr:uncharacterized protein LOC120144932 [Hibiscus syriacus]
MEVVNIESPTSNVQARQVVGPSEVLGNDDLVVYSPVMNKNKRISKKKQAQTGKKKICEEVILGGDFNTVKNESERVGVSFHQRSMSNFVDFISNGNLIDLPMSGGSFTRFRGGGSISASRLDRFLISVEVFSAFPQLAQSSMGRSLSDHKSILLIEEKIYCGRRTFKWFNHWAEDTEYVEMVKTVCEKNQGKDTTQFLREVRSATKKWEREKQWMPWQKFEVLKRDCGRFIGVTKESGSKKSRLKWFKEGDRNTRFFHLTVAKRGKANRISSLMVGNAEIRDQKELVKTLQKHFQLSYNEVNTLPVNRLDVPMRRSYITLILKKDGADCVEDFRSISLVRLAVVINEVVGDNQFAFIAGKRIRNCSLIANEVIDDLNQRKKKL